MIELTTGSIIIKVRNGTDASLLGQVLHEPNQCAQTKSYMWLYCSWEDESPQIVIYKYSGTRDGENAVDFLDGYSGYIMCDEDTADTTS